MAMLRRTVAIFLLTLIASGCVHLSPEVKAEMKRSAEPGDNNFARDASRQLQAGNASR